MKKIIVSVALVALVVLLASFPALAAPTTAETLTHLAQELMDAVAPGNKAVWERILADDCIYTDEEGVTKTKAQLLAELEPLPKGFTGSGKIVNVTVREHGAVAIIVYDIDEQELVYGHALQTKYRSTDTYLKQGTSWRMIASEVQVPPSDPPVIAVDAKKLGDYLGSYELAAGVVTHIARDGDHLTIARGDGKPRELSAAYTDVFFVKGTPGLYVFHRGADGQVVEILSRRKGNDLVSTRKP